MGGCDDGGCLGGGGLLGKMSAGGLKHLCFFCRGSGCSACQMCNCQNIAALLHKCRPYGEICGLRWYDFSSELVTLSHSSGSLNRGVTSQGPSPPGAIVLNLGDADSGSDLEAGIRLSGALIWGPGGNVEATYMGGQEWDSLAQAIPAIPNTPTLFSFISDFGTNPPGVGFDDTDRSIVQSVSNNSKFHSAEINYRRRTMGPYCRFQGSWLVGLRYVRFENSLLYAALGENDNTVNARPSPLLLIRRRGQEQPVRPANRW